MWVEEGVTENQYRLEQVLLLPIRPLPHIQPHSAACDLPHPGEDLRLHPLPHSRCGDKKKKKKAQMKEQIKAPEKIQLSNKEIANLSDA